MSESNVRITALAHVDEYRLSVRWTTDKAFIVDLREPVFRLKGLRPLRNPTMFARVRVGEDGYSVVWPGDLDMGAARLLEMALEQNGRADAVEFIRWRWRHGLSQ